MRFDILHPAILFWAQKDFNDTILGILLWKAKWHLDRSRHLHDTEGTGVDQLPRSCEGWRGSGQVRPQLQRTQNVSKPRRHCWSACGTGRSSTWYLLHLQYVLRSPDFDFLPKKVSNCTILTTPAAYTVIACQNPAPLFVSFWALPCLCSVWDCLASAHFQRWPKFVLSVLRFFWCDVRYALPISAKERQSPCKDRESHGFACTINNWTRNLGIHMNPSPWKWKRKYDTRSPDQQLQRWRAISKDYLLHRLLSLGNPVPLGFSGEVGEKEEKQRETLILLPPKKLERRKICSTFRLLQGTARIAMCRGPSYLHIVQVQSFKIECKFWLYDSTHHIHLLVLTVTNARPVGQRIDGTMSRHV